MRCLTCHKHGPFWGESCAYCGADKSLVQSLRMISALLIVGGSIGGGVYLGPIGLVGFGLLGLVSAVIVEKYAPRLFRRKPA